MWGMKTIKLYELKPIDFSGFKYFSGTKKNFGFISAICQMSPLLNMIINWRYRGYDLVIDTKDFKFKNGDEYIKPTVIDGGKK